MVQKNDGEALVKMRFCNFRYFWRAAVVAQERIRTHAIKSLNDNGIWTQSPSVLSHMYQSLEDRLKVQKLCNFETIRDMYTKGLFDLTYNACWY